MLNFENAEKSILYDQFVSPADMLLTDRDATEWLMEANMRYVAHPTRVNFMRLMAVAVRR